MEHRYRVDANGDLVPHGPGARAALAGQSGDYELLPTHLDLIAFLRSPPATQKGLEPRVVLTADAAGFQISDFIAFLSQSRFTGVLRLHSPTATRSLTLHEGEVRGAFTDDPSERLGEVIVRLGFLDQPTIDRIAPEAHPPRLGRALVEKGLLQPHDLWKCVTHQVSDIFHAIVLCREGTFVLINQEFDEKVGQHLKLSTHSLLMDSIRKVDEMAHFRKRIPHGRMYVHRKRPSDGRLEPEEDKVLSLADGSRNVFDLARAAQLSEFDATKVVFRLLEGGFAQLNERSAAAPAPLIEGMTDEDVGARTVINVYNAIFKEIRDELARFERAGKFVETANAALENQAQTTSPVLKGQTFRPDGTVAEGPLLTRFKDLSPELGSEPLASLKQALSDIMFFLLFHAGEVLEANADEQLAQRVKELLATLEGF